METRDNARCSPLEMPPEQFRAAGHELVDRLAELLSNVRQLPVTPGESPSAVRAALGNAELPDSGAEPAACLNKAFELLSGHSLFNGHPRFWGYVTSSAAPVGALADLLVSALNPNAGAWILSPMATEMEAQAIRWISEFIGYPTTCGGLLVSGGNMANFIGFLCARRAKTDWDVRKLGVARGPQLAVYASVETHTWIRKASDLFGLGSDCVRWIPADAEFRIRLDVLRERIQQDRDAGVLPFLVVGNAGTVSTGAVDPLRELARIALEEDLWFHVDGAYGAPAAALPDAGADLHALSLADSVAVDPHKWMYAPLEAGCALVKSPKHLLDTFEYSPAYYHFGGEDGDEPLNYYSYGPQNSRGSRAVKIWVAMQVAGRDGLRRTIGDDVRLAREAFQAIGECRELEALTCGLSIVTFRYIPADVDANDPGTFEYLNRLNEALLDRIQKSGELFVSNAVIGGKSVLRMCIVNFRTTRADIEALPGIVIRLGAAVDRLLRGA